MHSLKTKQAQTLNATFCFLFLTQLLWAMREKDRPSITGSRRAKMLPHGVIDQLNK
jgi:hypothetical protein